MTADLDALTEAWRVATHKANALKAEAEAADATADYTRKAIMDSLEGSVAAREIKAEIDQRYLDAVEAAIAARTAARNQQAEADAIKMRWESMRSENANRREEMRMHR